MFQKVHIETKWENFILINNVHDSILVINIEAKKPYINK
jgi:hypothetical protein